MARPIRLRFGPFLGQHTSIDSRYDRNTYAERSHQMRHEDGSARPRGGYRRFMAAPTYKGQACVAVKMLGLVGSIVSNAYYEEYLMVRRHGGSYCKLFRVDSDPTTSGFPNDAVIGKANAVDHIDLKSATAGNFTLTFAPNTTLNIARGATAAITAASIKSALEALSTVDVGDVTVTVTNSLTYEFDVEWDEQYRGTTVPALSINVGTLSGGTGTATCTRTTQAQDYQMADSYWDYFVWDGDVHLYNYAAGDEGGGSPSDSEPLLKYTMGDPSSLVAIKPPATPVYSDDPIVVQYRKRAGSSTLSYALHNWGGVASATIVWDASVFTSGDILTNGQQILVRKQTTTLGVGTFQIDLSTLTVTGNRDWQYNDCFLGSIKIKYPELFQFDPNTLKIYLVNADGSPVTEELDLTLKVNSLAGTSGETLVSSVDVYAKFKNKGDRTLWDNVKHWKFEMQVTRCSATDADNDFYVSPFTVGGIVDWGVVGDRFETFHGVFQLGYARRVSGTGLGSGVAGVLVCAAADLLGTLAPNMPDGTYLGTIPYLTIPCSDASDVDQVVVCERRRKTSGENQVVMSEWREIATVTDGGAATVDYTFGSTEKDFNDASPYDDGDFASDNIVKAKPMFGRMCYSFRNQRENIRWTDLGTVNKFANLDGSNVDITDPEGGSNFALSNDQGEFAVDFWEVGNLTIFLSHRGVHYQPGTRPRDMGFPRRINGAPGIVHDPDDQTGGRHASCRFNFNGVEGVAYIAQDKQVWFVGVTTVADLESGRSLVCLSDYERNEVERHLLQRDPDVNELTIALNTDLRSSSLWVSYSYRAMVGRRASKVDGERYFEHYTYGNQTNGTWLGTGYTLFSFDQDRGIKCTSSTGYIDELEYDSTNDMARIGGEDATPSSTDLANDVVEFDQDPEWPLGLGLQGDDTCGNFLAATTYYVRPYAIGSYQFYDTLAHAKAGGATGKLNLNAEVTTTLRPLGRDNGNPIEDGTIYWKGPVVNLGSEACADRCDVYRRRLESRPMVQLWCRRNPESSARQLAAGRETVRQSQLSQGSEFQVTLYLEDNSPPVYFVDQWVMPKGRRPHG